MNKRLLHFSAFVLLVVPTLLLVPPKSASAQENQANNEETYRLLNLFGDVFERVRADFVEELTDEEDYGWRLDYPIGRRTCAWPNPSPSC